MGNILPEARCRRSRRYPWSMCGIVGYVGHRSALDVVLGGLQRLEYRGYDSAGVALVGDEGSDSPLVSAKRAGIVAQELQAMGFIPEMMTAKGWGEANPIASNDTEEGQLKNRRVEVIINR